MADLRAQLAYIATRTDIRGLTIRGRVMLFVRRRFERVKNNFQSEQSLEEVIGDSSKMGDFFLAVRSMPQVVVFLLHGAAMAGGLGMACAGDIVIAAKNTKMGLTETSIGVVPAQIGRYIVERVGEFKARYIMLTAKRFTAVEGADMGLVDFLVDDGGGEVVEADTKPMYVAVRQWPMRPKKLLEQNKVLGAQEMIRYAGELFAEPSKAMKGVRAWRRSSKNANRIGHRARSRRHGAYSKITGCQSRRDCLPRDADGA